MKNKKFIHCFSVILRAATLFSKFALVIMLAKLIPGGDVGLYGLLSAAIGYAIFIVGFEFYTYSTREMIAYPREQWGWMLKNQIVLTISVYIMFLPLLYFLYYLGILPVGTEFWFIALLIVEYVSQEINRVLITGRNYLLASIILFLRQGIWCWVVVAIMLMMPSLRNVYTVLIVWLVASGAACILYSTWLSYLPTDKFTYTVPFNGDSRGIFCEMLKTPSSGQFSFFTAHPGITRGGHYHHTKNEKFLVIRGQARFKFEHVITGERYELNVSFDEFKIVETVPGWTHDITNIGNDELVVMLWANEIFNRDEPDTIARAL